MSGDWLGQRRHPGNGATASVKAGRKYLYVRDGSPGELPPAVQEIAGKFDGVLPQRWHTLHNFLKKV